MKDKCPCFFCNADAEHARDATKCGGGDWYDCKNCGKYFISDFTRDSIDFEPLRHMIAGYLMETKKDREYMPSNTDEQNFKNWHVDGARIKDISENHPFPNTMQKFDKILRYIYEETSGIFGKELEILFIPPSVAYVKDRNELNKMIKELVTKRFCDKLGGKWIRSDNGRGYDVWSEKIILTYEGFEHIEQLLSGKRTNDTLLQQQESSDVSNNLIVTDSENAADECIVTQTLHKEAIREQGVLSRQLSKCWLRWLWQALSSKKHPDHQMAVAITMIFGLLIAAIAIIVAIVVPVGIARHARQNMDIIMAIEVSFADMQNEYGPTLSDEVDNNPIALPAQSYNYYRQGDIETNYDESLYGVTIEVKIGETHIDRNLNFSVSVIGFGVETVDVNFIYPDGQRSRGLRNAGDLWIFVVDDIEYRVTLISITLEQSASFNMRQIF